MPVFVNPFASAAVLGHARLLVIAALWLTLVLATGCTHVTTIHQVGTPDKQLAKLFEGDWQRGENRMHVRVIGDGSLSILQVRWDTTRKDWHFTRREADITRDGTKVYAYLRAVPKRDKKGKPLPRKANEAMLFGRIYYTSQKPDQVLLFRPRQETFADAIESGKLSGRVSRTKDGEITNIAITATSQALQTYLNNTPAKELYIADKADIFRRLSSNKE